MQSSITCDIPHTLIQFPVGELHVTLGEPTYGYTDITWNFRKSDDIVELLLFWDALKRMGIKLRRLEIPYFPFSRQDRINQRGEPLSVALMASIINSMQAEQVIIYDPHSDVTPVLIQRCIIVTQEVIFATKLSIWLNPFYLISPDAGALKKIYKLAAMVKPIAVVECSKRRNTSTGEITGTFVPNIYLDGSPCVIVDDICDGGRTFIELAKLLKQQDAGEITLCVTHGFFTKGLQVFDGLIDAIYTRTGRVK